MPEVGGLEVNINKCELFLFGGTVSEQENTSKASLKIFSSFARVSAEELAYLGFPLLDCASTAAFQNTTDEVMQLTRKPVYCSLTTLCNMIKNCLGPIKLPYLLRTCRTHHFPKALHNFEKQLRVSLCRISNANIGDLPGN